MSNNTTIRLQLSASREFRVDREKGIIRNLSLITGDREATGHGFYIDQKTVDMTHGVIAQRGGRLKGAVRHASLLDLIKRGNDRVEEIPGFFSNAAVKGNQVAADFEFFDSFKADEPKAYNRILEMAEKTPDLFGISIEPYGFGVYVAEDGREFSEKPKDAAIKLKYAGMPAFRVVDLAVGAFVDEPAANSGLFAKLSAVFGGKQPEPTALRELADAFSAWATKHAGGNTVPSQGNNEPESKKLSAMQIIQTIKAEFGAKPALFSQAMTILGNKPDITIEALRAEMVQADLASALGQVTTLGAKVTELEGKITGLSTERDDWKKKYETLKDSGHAGGDVNLGKGGNAGSTSAENPWMPGAVNFTRQCELERSNPTLAATLKAAATQAAHK